jgi:phosphopantothenoylcysteine decarboxylase
MSCAEANEGRAPRVLICASGSVATVKVPEIVTLCAQFAEVRVVCTKSAMHFLNMAHSYNANTWNAFQSLRHRALVYTDQDEWDAYAKVGVDPVVHIEVRYITEVVTVFCTLPSSSDAKLPDSCRYASDLKQHR